MNDFFRKLKYKFGKYAIYNLSLHVTLIFAIGYLLIMSPIGAYIYSTWLAFFPREVLHGQIWRIFTAVLFPPVTSSNIFWVAICLLLYYNFSSIVERMMGEFEFNIYFFGSILIGELGAILSYLITGINYPYLPIYTHFAIIMAFSIMYPDASVLLMFVIPIKAKWIAIAEALIYVYNFITGSIITKISIVAAFIPVVIFFFLTYGGGSGGNVISNLRFRMKQRKRQKDWRDQWR